MINVKAITKKYREKTVVDDVTIDLPRGKIIAFIGSNGAGKSTLVSIISRTLSRNKGDVYVEGKELAQWNPQELSQVLSVLKQTNNLNIRLTIRELVSFGRYPYSQGRLSAEDNKTIDKAIKYMKLKDIEDIYIDELSGGQRQMAFIAMIIAQDTEYIFLDEPLNNLDMKHSVQIMKILKDLVEKEGKTIMIVIHDINFVSCYADYIVAMKDGKIICSGETEDVMNSSSLREIYNMDIPIKEIDGKNICLYYL